MTTQRINFRDCCDAEDLADALDALIDEAGARHSSEIHLTRPIRITLIEETLSDGSKVFNLRIEKLAEVSA